MTEQGIHQNIGLPQLFVNFGRNGFPILIFAKVVDDLLISGTKDEVKNFHASIEKRFKVGRFLTDSILIFKCLYIQQRADGSIILIMCEFLKNIKAIEISRSRRKEQKKRCTESEIKAFLGRPGALNYLVLGIIPQAA